MSPLAGAPLGRARRLVVKIGSSILVDEAKGEVRRDWLEALTNDVARLHKGGCEVVLVSSGAIRLGRTHLKLASGALRLEESQAAAATGQIRLAQAYQEALARHGITVAQILLTLNDSEERRRYLNARQTLATLLNELELAIALNYYKDLLIAAAEWNATTVEGGIRAMRNRIFSFFKQDPRNVAAFGAAFRETLSDAEAYMFATAYEEWCRQFPTWKLPECYLTDVNNVLYIEAIQTVAARSDELEADAEADAEDAPDEQQDAGMPGEENQ